MSVFLIKNKRILLKHDFYSLFIDQEFMVNELEDYVTYFKSKLVPISDLSENLKR